ncbi:MAG: GntR family transcriptional regulator, partial [Bifidobacterium sp.]|nr:GntR family transcriptional regulator [Bifidobacterium sp.]
MLYCSISTRIIWERGTDVIITVDKADALPLYEQLRRQIIAGLARGELEPGDMLPSVRRLAKDLGINLHTV